MAIVRVKIHPAIGIARVGNSPDEFFIGPERVHERPDPPGGFKDAHCRVKRQAARFRAFAYHDDGSVVELTAATAQIEWTVQVANKKAAVSNRNPGVDPALLTIAPAAVTLFGPHERQTLDNGTITLDGMTVTVPLGEARTDDDGSLVFLGGFGHSASPANTPINSFYSNAGWYDDVCDGPVHATVTVDGNAFEADPAWVIVAPPKFAPQFDSVITLYDTLYQQAAQEGWLTPPAVPSYTMHIHPILQRARDTRWVTDIGSWPHRWPDPVYDATTAQHIYGRLRGTAGAVDGDPNNDDMPALAGGAQLTQAQRDWLFAWQGGNYTQDWAGPPQPTAAIDPAGLDQAALEACVGAAFFPGIEAGGISENPVLDPTTFVGAIDPLRINATVRGPGDLSAFMALPWQADFNACDDGWWPVPRPNWVKVPAENAFRDWDRQVDNHKEMVENWHRLGFVVRQGDEFVETERCDVSENITLLTPHLDFGEVPQGPAGIPGYAAQAILFEVVALGAPLTLEVQVEPMNPRFMVLTPSVTVGPTNGSEVATARLFVAYQTGAALESVMDEITIAHAGSSATWTIGLEAETVARRRTAAALVLDRSGSMAEDRGDGQSKHTGLKEAALAFADLMHEGDGLAVIRYDHDAQRLLGVTELDAPGSPFGARSQVKNLLLGHQLDPAGSTSIGDGIHVGRLALDEVSGYALESLVIVTDGNENSPRWISEVAGSIDARTYAVGIGTPENTSAAVLQDLAGNHGGYFLSTGALSGEQGLRLKKYFLQILAGLNHAQIALDPQGIIPWGGTQSLPFHLSEADDGIEVILLAPDAATLEFRLQTPDGFIIDPGVAAANGMQYVSSTGLRFYRIALPAELHPGRFDQEGTWRVLLRYGQEQQSGGAAARRRAPTSAQLRARPGLLSRAQERTHLRQPERVRSLHYSVNVNVYSRISLSARLTQSGREPGARMRVEARLLECDQIPVAGATIWAEVTAPDGRELTLPLNQQTASGDSFAEFQAAAPGMYRVRVRARGVSARGHAYHREQTRTGVVWHGADAPSASNPRERARLCELLECLIGPSGALTPTLEKKLEGGSAELRRVQACIRGFCRPDPEREVRAHTPHQVASSEPAREETVADARREGGCPRC